MWESKLENKNNKLWLLKLGACKHHKVASSYLWAPVKTNADICSS